VNHTDHGIRRVLITGGASGLGRACAHRLRDEHHEVITADVADGADVRLDVSDDAAVGEVVSQLGPIDILLNSAGVIGPNVPLWETTRAQWDATFAVNVHGTVSLCRAVVPGMVQGGWGRIVNFASIAGKDGNPNLSAYSATKAAVIGLTKSLGKELATTGVLVNAIAPAVIDTEMNAATAPDVLAHITSLIPMKRVGRPQEVAELVAWLVSERCTFSTGAVYDISGGRATY
jgi:NAD(P)-dependent dehydrogenase (short-subunit alcohol dehydrogenase family)